MSMGTYQEIAVTCCLNDPVASASVWDVQTGTSLITYRGETVTPVGLSLLAGEYIVAALQDKPFLRVWPVNSQQPLSSLRLVCPGRVSHAQASPDACYIAVTVAEKIHIYQVASGRLLGSGVRHYQHIRVVQWSPDSSTVVCGGEDGLVTIWPLDALVAAHNTPEPQRVLSDHSLAVTDLKVTAGSRPRLLSVSMDRTCKIYELYQGTLLLSLVFDQPLTSVISAALDTDVFVGTTNGSIWQVGLLSPPRHLEYHVMTEGQARQFSGHSKAVQCLSTSLSGELLMSGSSDGSVIIWHIASCQCLRTFTLKGPVTNAFFAPKPKQMFDNELKPSIFFNSFQSGNSEVGTFVEVINSETLRLCDRNLQELFPIQAADSSEERVQSLKMDINLLKSINSNLYKFSVDKIISNNNILPRLPELEFHQVNIEINNPKKDVHKKLKKTKCFRQKLNQGKKNKQKLSPLPKTIHINERIKSAPKVIKNSNYSLPAVFKDNADLNKQKVHIHNRLKNKKGFNKTINQGKKKEQVLPNKPKTKQINKTLQKIATDLIHNTYSYVPVANGNILASKKKKRKRNKNKQIIEN